MRATCRQLDLNVVVSAACCCHRHACIAQGFIQRAGPDILQRELPPKRELLLALAPTQLQRALQRELLVLLAEQGKSSLRDQAVRHTALE